MTDDQQEREHAVEWLAALLPQSFLRGSVQESAAWLYDHGVRVALQRADAPTVQDVCWLAERVGMRVIHPCGAQVESWETEPHPEGCQCQNEE